MNIGSFVHFSIPVSDMNSAIEFYGAMFGWKFRQMTPTYYMIEEGLGALSLEKESVKGPTMPILYFYVSNIDASLEKAAQIGGQVILRRSDAGDGQSFFATFFDRDRNVLGIWPKN